MSSSHMNAKLCTPFNSAPWMQVVYRPANEAHTQRTFHCAVSLTSNGRPTARLPTVHCKRFKLGSNDCAGYTSAGMTQAINSKRSSSSSSVSCYYLLKTVFDHVSAASFKPLSPEERLSSNPATAYVSVRSCLRSHPGTGRNVVLLTSAGRTQAPYERSWKADKEVQRNL
jgi:hypothetical protein